MENGEQPITPTYYKETEFVGLTKREYFAGLAMQGLLHTYNGQLPFNEIAGAFAMESVIMADALLAELEKTKQQEQ
jgi:acetyl-CoA acetyltransferase